jgi:hypothetical protein
MLAVVKDALAASKTFSMQRTSGKKWFLEAEEWFDKAEREWIFSFENICDTLGISPHYLREGLHATAGEDHEKRLAKQRSDRLRTIIADA